MQSVKPKQKAILLSECLELYTSNEQLGQDDTWYCPRCKEHKQATKKLDLWRLPKLLIIHLKRFSYTRWYRDKIETFVDFPVRCAAASAAMLILYWSF